MFCNMHTMDEHMHKILVFLVFIMALSRIIRQVVSL
jgi:hypothetical protein